MKLVQKINLLLLPIIIVFAAFFIFVTYKSMLDYQKRQVQHTVELQLESLQRELSNELNYLKLIPLEVSTYLHAIISARAQYQNQSLQQLMVRLNQSGANLQWIQLFDYKGNLLVSSDIEGHYSQLPVQAVESMTDNLGGAPIVSLNAGFFFGGNQQLFYYRSYRLMVNKTQRSPGARAVVVLVSRVDSVANRFLRLTEQFGQLTEIKFEPRSVVTGSVNDAQFEHSFEDGVNIRMSNSEYQITVAVPESVITDRLPYSLAELSFFISVVVVVSYLILIGLLHFQVLSPISLLLDKIKNTRFGDNVDIKQMKSKSEVAELHNAYVIMLKKLNRLASFDYLTGLSNRVNFQVQFERQLSRAQRIGTKMALLYIDLDNFKHVNDHFGHATGDRLLKLFSERLQKSIRPTDVAASLGKGEIARLAGDEFSLLLTDVESIEAAEKVAARVLKMFESGFLVDGVNHNVQASIGIVMIPDDGTDAQSLLQCADAAMYQAKMKGKNRYQFYNQQIAGGIQKKQYIEKVLIKAIHHGHFVLEYMPIFEAKTRNLAGVEVLVRCPALANKGIGPDEFIPVAESTGLIKEIDVWVINESLTRMNYLTDKYGFNGFFAINISAAELHNREFVGQVSGLLSKHQVEPSRVELEITETSFVDNMSSSIEMLKQLKSHGVSLSLDDFGTGYTAFSQLMEFPVDRLKIDRSFIQGLGGSASQKQRMVDIVLALADLYQLEVIAEGVENEEQIQYLKDRGCEYLQGYYLSSPLNWDVLQSRVSDNDSKHSIPS